MPNNPLNPETEKKMFVQMWSTQNIRNWFEARERFLIDSGMDRFINGKMDSAKGFAGQLVELRALRGKMSGAWAEGQLRKKEETRLRVLEQEKKLS